MSETPSNESLDENRQTQFVTLLNKHHRQLLGYLAALVGHRTDAEDVLQRASMTMWRRFGQFELGTDFLGWATTVAFYEAKSFLRSAGRARVRFSEATLALLAEERTLDLSRQNTRLEVLEGCIEKLDEGSRELVRTVYLDRANVMELARAVGRSPQTFYNRLNLIRRALVECVERRLAAGGLA